MNAEKLAYWFFRLNGCFTFENFIVHPDRFRGQETEADLIALRFQHRCELPMAQTPMQDAPFFVERSRFINVYLVETTTGPCKLNGAWTEPAKGNVRRVLNAMGFVPQELMDCAVEQLYQELSYKDDIRWVRYVAIGRETSKQEPLSKAPQFTWNEILCWIHSRFNEYRQQKADHDQWDESGKQLFASATDDYRRDVRGFVEHWLQTIGVAVPEQEL